MVLGTVLLKDLLIVRLPAELDTIVAVAASLNNGTTDRSDLST